MNVCVRCNGEGIETFYDDRLEQHICYHCNGSGRVSDETMFHDQLYCVAYSLALQYVHCMIQASNNDPEGDGFSLIAAENGLSHSDYTQHLIDVKTDEFGIELANKPLQEQQLLIAWNNLPAEPIHKNKKQEVLVSEFNHYDSHIESDYILF